MSNETKQQMTAVDAAIEYTETCGNSVIAGKTILAEDLLNGYWKSSKILAAEVRRLREENARLRELTQWRPIETAPRDESILIMSKICESTFGIEEGFVDSETGNIESSVTGDGIVGASHWLPLPAAPESEVRNA